MSTEIVFNDPGEGIKEGVVVSLNKKAGEFVRKHVTLLEIETVKSLVEIPCPMDGKVLDWLVEPDQVVHHRQVLCLIEQDSK